MIAFKYTLKKPEKNQVSLKFDGNRIFVDNNPYPYATISFQHNLRDGIVLLYLHDETIVEVRNNVELDKFIDFNQNNTRPFFKMIGIKYGIILPIVIAIAGLLYATYSYYFPKISKTIAMEIPKERAYEIGKDTLEILEKKLLKPSRLSIEQQKQLRKEIFERTKNLKDLPAINIVFRSSKEMGANAMALPNGTIVLLDDLVKLSSSNDEIYAVVAHEIGHVYHRHAIRQMIQDSVLYAGLILVTGDVTSFATVAGLLPVILAQQHYSKEFELEADLYAYHWMKKQKINPKYFVRMLQKIEKSHNSKHEDKYYYLNSHPDMKERVKIFLQ